MVLAVIRAAKKVVAGVRAYRGEIGYAFTGYIEIITLNIGICEIAGMAARIAYILQLGSGHYTSGRLCGAVRVIRPAEYAGGGELCGISVIIDAIRVRIRAITVKGVGFIEITRVLDKSKVSAPIIFVNSDTTEKRNRAGIIYYAKRAYGEVCIYYGDIIPAVSSIEYDVIN